MSDISDSRQDTMEALTEAGFKQAVSAPGIVLVDCWAAWCKACKDFQPVFEDAASRYPAHRFAKLNTQKEEALVASLGIEHIPALLLFRDGLMLLKQPGYFDADGIDNIIAQAVALDMNEVRAAIAAEQANEQPAD